jgi:hypothetical protein
MAKLTTRARKQIPTKSFALPGRRYPIEDASHARNALARVSQHGSPAEKAAVRAKVHSKYPGIAQTHHNEPPTHHHEHHPDGRPLHQAHHVHSDGYYVGRIDGHGSAKRTGDEDGYENISQP